MTTKITDANIDSDKQDNNAFNISLLGFKMAVNEGLTVFNLVDGVVDEFNDESGTDEAEGSNDTYCATSDFYQNVSITPACFSAGFSTTAITEPDTSVAATYPAHGVGTFGTFTVPCGMTSMTFRLWGAGGGGATTCSTKGGGGGFTTGNLAVTSGQTVYVGVAEGGLSYQPSPLPGVTEGGFLGGGDGANCNHATGGGMSILANNTAPNFTSPQPEPGTTPGIYTIAAGGGSAGNASNDGGAGGGLIGDRGGQTVEQTSAGGGHGGGGSQTGGGQGATSPNSTPGDPFFSGGPGAYLKGASPADTGNGMGRGGGGFYGGGGGADGPMGTGYSAGGGSSYIGNPQVSSASTEEGSEAANGGDADPNYIACTGIGRANDAGTDGYVLLTGTGCTTSPGASTTIVSTAFTSTSVATSARIVVFEEDVETPTLNTDIIASVSRDGTTFTNATLSDSGYVTGSSGQRILTGQADISGQPSGQSMRWKLALANNTVKIHGVSLQWS